MGSGPREVALLPGNRQELQVPLPSGEQGTLRPHHADCQVPSRSFLRSPNTVTSSALPAVTSGWRGGGQTGRGSWPQPPPASPMATLLGPQPAPLTADTGPLCWCSVSLAGPEPPHTCTCQLMQQEAKQFQVRLWAQSCLSVSEHPPLPSENKFPQLR